MQQNVTVIPVKTSQNIPSLAQNNGQYNYGVQKHLQGGVFYIVLLGVYTCMLDCDRTVTSVYAVLLFNWVVLAFRKRKFRLDGFHRISIKESILFKEKGGRLVFTNNYSTEPLEEHRFSA